MTTIKPTRRAIEEQAAEEERQRQLTLAQRQQAGAEQAFRQTVDAAKKYQAVQSERSEADTPLVLPGETPIGRDTLIAAAEGRDIARKRAQGIESELEKQAPPAAMTGGEAYPITATTEEGQRLQEIAAARRSAREEKNPLTATEVQQRVPSARMSESQKIQKEIDDIKSSPALGPDTVGRTYSPEERQAAETAKQETLRIAEQRKRDAEAEELRVQKERESGAAAGLAAAQEEERKTLERQRRDLSKSFASSVDNTAFQTSLSLFSPEDQALLAPYVKGLGEQLGALREAQDLAGKVYESGLGTSTELALSREHIAEMSRARVESTLKMTTDLLTDLRQKREEQIAADKTLRLTNLQREEDMALYRAEKAKRKKIETMTNRLLLAGGWGSGAGLKEIDEAESTMELEISQLQQAFTSDRQTIENDANARLTDIYATYATGILSSTENYLERQSAIDQYEEGGVEAKAKEQQRLGENFAKEITDHRLKSAEAIHGLANDIRTIRNEEIERKVKKENEAWDRMEWVKNTFGSDAPKELLQSLSRDLPGIDAQSLTSIPTLTELREKRLAAGRGEPAISAVGMWSSSSLPKDSAGNSITEEQFLRQKESDYYAFGQYGPISPDQRRAWQAEYDAKKKEDFANTPFGIMSDFRKKPSKTFTTLGAMKKGEGWMKQLINQGQIKEARDYVDTIGIDLPQKVLDKIAANKDVQNIITKMKQLTEMVKDEIGPLPAQGPMWTFINRHISTDPKYRQLKVLVDSTVSNLTRSYGQTGQLTDRDVQLALSSLFEPNVSYGALLAGMEEARQRSITSTTNLINTYRAEGYRVSEANVPKMDIPLNASAYDQGKGNFLNSLPK